MATYIIEYTIFNKDYPIKDGKMKVKNRVNEFDAKVKLESFLKKNYDFTRLVIHSCTEDTLDVFDRLFGGFNSNPFRT